MTTLMRVGWGTGDPSFRQMFTSQFLPEGTKAQFDAFNGLQAANHLARMRGALFRGGR